MAREKRVAVITGASSGIGRETAKTLAAQGWHVIAVGRDPARSDEALAELRAVATGEVEMLRGDLALMADAARLADEIAARTDRIHVLINNAGGVAKEKVITAEGREANFAGNHLGPFLLTNRLLPLLRHAAAESAPGEVRIVNTSSNGSEMIPDLHWADLELLGNFETGRAYCQGKLANVMFARALAKRLAADGIVVHALHPGTIASNFINHASESTKETIRAMPSISSEEGAVALTWLATGEEPGRSTGGYYHRQQAVPANPVADDDAAVERLWAESERLIAEATA